MEDPTRARLADLAYLTHHTIRGVKILALMVAIAIGVAALLLLFY